MAQILDYEPSRPYAAAAVAGGFVFLAGETGTDPATGAVAEGITAQTEQALENIRGTLRRVGGDLGNIVRLTVYLTSISDIRAVSAVRQRLLPGPVPSATIEVSRFVSPQALIEIEATAVLADR